MILDPDARRRRQEAATARRREAWADARRRIAEARERRREPFAARLDPVLPAATEET